MQSGHLYIQRPISRTFVSADLFNPIVQSPTDHCFKGPQFKMAVYSGCSNIIEVYNLVNEIIVSFSNNP